MDNDFLTAGDLALYERRRDYHDGHYGGAAITGVGLAAGLGGGALLLGLAVAWGVNQASKARAHGNETTISALSNNVNQLANIAAAERTSRENWQLQHTPTIKQYVDVSTAANASACSNAFATAQNQIVADALSGRSELCPQKVSLYSAPAPCPCPTPSCAQCGY